MIARRVEAYGPWMAACAVSLAFLLFILAGLYTVHQQEHVNQRLCQQTVGNRDATRVTWEAARDLVLRGEERPRVRDQTNDFFNSILGVIPPLECIDNKPVVKEE